MAYSVLALLLVFCLSQVTAEPVAECVPRNATYYIKDSQQCDKYYACSKNSKGKVTELLCDDGFVFSDYSHCDYPHNVDCSRRPNLQPPQTKGDKNCARLNGFYEFPPSKSCQKFYHCLEGTAYEKTCPDDIIFDKGTCVHPDMSEREGCSAAVVHNFKCPNTERFARLRFGDHDRHANPKDCRKFFICLMDGKPRTGGCPLGKVFNDKTGFCDKPKNVPNCKDYYGKKTMEELKRQQAITEGVEDISKLDLGSSEESSEESREAVEQALQHAASGNQQQQQNAASENQQQQPQVSSQKKKSQSAPASSKFNRLQTGTDADKS